MELHTACVNDANTTIAGHHLWFSYMRMRAFLQEHGLLGCEVSFCRGCHEELSEQILENYKAMERFDEGARFFTQKGSSAACLWRISKTTFPSIVLL